MTTIIQRGAELNGLANGKVASEPTIIRDPMMIRTIAKRNFANPFMGADSLTFRPFYLPIRAMSTLMIDNFCFEMVDSVQFLIFRRR